ncbi:Copia protein, partial [Mucuna pruriens]
MKQGEEDKVYLLKKILYGLKQAPRAWYSQINDHLLNIDFAESLSESTLHVKNKGNNILIVSSIDNTRLVEDFKQEIMQVFEMIDLGLMTYFLGI